MITRERTHLVRGLAHKVHVGLVGGRGRVRVRVRVKVRVRVRIRVRDAG